LCRDTRVEAGGHIQYNHLRCNMKSKEFITFLDSEIENLRSEIQRPGWTSWALSGALAAVVWLLLSLVEQGGYSLKAVGSSLLVIWLLIFSFGVAKALVGPSLRSERIKGRLMAMEVVQANVPDMVMIVGALGFFIAITVRLSSELGSVATDVLLATISFNLLSALLLVVIIAMRIPVPANARHRLQNMINAVLLVLGLVSIWYQMRFLWISPGTGTVADVRFALVIAAVFYLSFRLVSVPRGTLTLDTLTTIRREVVLGRMAIERASEQVDIALAGMRASDLLESYVSKLLSLYRDAGAELGKCISCLDELDKSLSATGGKVSPDQEASKRPDMDALRSSAETAARIVTKDIPRAYSPIRDRLRTLEFWGFLKDAEDLQDLDRKLKAVQADLDEQIKEFTGKFEAFTKAMQADEAVKG
jgi:hypothetical protein